MRSMVELSYTCHLVNAVNDPEARSNLVYANLAEITEATDLQMIFVTFVCYRKLGTTSVTSERYSCNYTQPAECIVR